jgi:type IV pilus assembly protein PilX
MRPPYRTETLPGMRQKSITLPSSQHGISLMIVLIALVVMSLSAVGLIRMVDTGSLVVGNVAFKQSTTSAADSAVEAAIAWIRANDTGTTLYQNNTGAGYYASSLDELDISGKSSRTTRVLVDWKGDGCAYASSGSYAACIAPTGENSNNGYTTSYIITRMCKAVGDPNAVGNGCARPISNASGQSPKRGEVKYGEDKRFGSVSSPYFRIAVRSEGPRNTVSFTESYVHF